MWLPSSAGMLARLTSLVEAGSASIDWRRLSLQLTAHGLLGQIEVGGDVDSTGPAKDWLQALQRGCIAQQVSKKHACIQLLAVSCRLCSAGLFLEHQSAWLQLAQAQLQARAESALVQDALWTLIGACFSRYGQLHQLAALRKEASSQASKLMVMLQPTLHGAGLPSTACLAAVAAALAALPTAFRGHAKILQPWLQRLSNVREWGGTPSTGVMQCLSLLPRVAGTADAWEDAMRRHCATVHLLLDTAFMGMDAQDVQFAAARAAALSDPAAAAAAQQTLQSAVRAGDGAAAGVRWAVAQMAAELDGVERLLTGNHPVPVAVPAQQVLGLMERVLAMNAASGLQPPSASGWQELCAALPGLQAAALRLVGVLMQATRAALLAHFGAVARLLTGFLQVFSAEQGHLLHTFARPVRQQVYATSAMLAQMAGVGATQLLAEPALKAALAEMYGPPGGQPLQPTPAGRQKAKKKGKKRSAAEAGLADDSAEAALAALLAGPYARSDEEWAGEVGTQCAAVGLLDTVLEVGGAALPAEQKALAEATVAHIAATTAAAQLRLSSGHETSARARGVSRLAAAALKALATAVIVPGGHRPVLLPEAVALFTEALSSAAPEVAAAAHQALARCEVLLHPRAASHAPAPQPLSASVAHNLEQERALLGQAPLFWSSLAPQSAAASTSAAAGAAQGAGSSQQLLLAAPEQVAGGDMAAVGTAQACSLPSSHRLQAEAGADGGASHALLAASQAFYQVMQQHMEPTVAGPQAMAVNGLAGPEAVLKSVSDGPGEAVDAKANLSAAAAALETAQTDAAAAAAPVAEIQHAIAPPSTGEQQGAMGAVHQSDGSSGWGGAAGAQKLGASQLALPAQPVPAPPSAVTKVLPAPPLKASLFRQQVESSDSEGPLPSIDSGPSEEDEDMDDASS